MDGWVGNGRMGGWADGRMGRWVDGRVGDRRTDEWLGGWVSGWVEETQEEPSSSEAELVSRECGLGGLETLCSLIANSLI